MNPQYQWPPTLAGVVAAGWLIGSSMSGHSRAADSGGKRAPSVPKTLPKATEDEEKNSAASLPAALRETNNARRVHHLYAAVEKMSPGEIAAAVAQAQRMTEPDRITLLPILFGKWAETEPQAALDSALGLAGYASFGAVATALEVWVTADLPGAMAWAQKLPAGVKRGRAMSSLIDIFAKRDPAAAFQFLQTLPKDQINDGAYFSIFSEWATRDPRAAASQVSAIPRGSVWSAQNREYAIGQIAFHWAETDPAAALAWARQLPDAGTRSSAVNRAFDAWANFDPKAASAEALALPAGTIRSRNLGNLVQTISQHDVPAALHLIEQIPAGETRNNAVQSVVAQWAINDPAAAAAYAAALPPGNAATSALLGVASQWARKDPRAAATYFTALPPGHSRNAALRDIAGIWADTDVGAALALVDRLPDAEMKRDAQSDVVSRWAQKDPHAAADYCIKKPLHLDENGSGPLAQVLQEWAAHSPEQALAWVRQLRDGKVRGNLLGRIVYRMASTDPEEAARLVMQLPVAYQLDAASEVSSRWSRLDPAAAAVWVVQLPEGQARSWAHRNIASQWAALDPVKTVSWIESLPASDSHDAAVQAYAEAVRHADPVGASTLASTIADPKIRDTTLAGIAYEWLRTDKKAAVKWIGESTAMSAEMKQSVLPKN